MIEILGYPLVYWTARIVLVLLMWFYAGFLVLVFGRFFHPRNVKAMLCADLPAWMGARYPDEERSRPDGHTRIVEVPRR